jgi:transposase
MSDPIPSPPPFPVHEPPGKAIQRQLPVFPSEALEIAQGLSVVRNEGMVVYFSGMLPIFTHPEGDEPSFKMFLAQLCAQGTCHQADLVRALGVNKRSLIRWVDQFRKEGGASFFKGRKASAGPKKRIWTEENVARAQALLDEGLKPPEAARRLGVKEDTMRKALLHGELRRPDNLTRGPTKGERSARDAKPLAGRACHDTDGRAAAAAGLLPGGVARTFGTALDVPFAGVLCALPALLANGLLHGVEDCFELAPGFYPVMTYFLLTAFMLLVRLRTPEKLRYSEPGEWGLLLGHDRCPEVKTLRAKLEALARPEQVSTWSGGLTRFWMEQDEGLAGILYVDGHVRLYHGSQTKLPARFVSRQRLCLRSLMDYWVNDQEGRPFFVVPAVDTEGLLAHLTQEIIPRLREDVPGQPAEAELLANPDLHRFDVIVDREGFSPEALRKAFSLHRAAITTYRRHPYDPWPEAEFQTMSVPLAHGLRQDMLIAARPFGSVKDGLREIRRLTPKGTQTAIVTANRTTPVAQVAGRMFSRWSQENYFKYAAQHFGIDRLAGYSAESIPVATTMVNPAWRKADAEVRKLTSELHRLLQEKGGSSLAHGAGEGDLAKWQRRMAILQEGIEALEPRVAEAKIRRKQAPKRVTLEDIPEEDRPRVLSPTRKHLVDTLAMVAYRAETAQVLILRDNLARDDDARSLAQALYQTSGDLIVDEPAGTLTVRLHRGASLLADKAVAGLLEVLNESDICYPGTALALKYELVSV